MTITQKIDRLEYLNMCVTGEARAPQSAPHPRG